MQRADDGYRKKLHFSEVSLFNNATILIQALEPRTKVKEN